VADLLLFGPLAAYCAILIGRMRLAIEREQAERALRASKDRLQLCLDAALLGWWQYEPRSGLVSVDRRFKEIFDVTKDPMPIEEIKKLVHPADAERFWVDSEASLDPADPQHSPREYRVQRRNGEVRWVEVRRLACFEGAGGERRCASLVGTVQDITERKKREEERRERQEREHLLMSEINHRAKNMLSVVDAIAHQTATRNPEDFVERFSERIQALSANQDLLVGNEWKRRKNRTDSVNQPPAPGRIEWLRSLAIPSRKRSLHRALRT
jgi:PAS domain S-box-containing protein